MSSDRLAAVLERLARLEQSVEDLRTEVKMIQEEIARRNGYMKWTLVLLVTVLSFVAAMFGLGWRPPAG